MKQLLLLAMIMGISTGDTQPVTRSGIDGFVTMDVTAAATGASIGVDSMTKGGHFRATTSNSGYYLVDDIEPGAYSVWAEVKGIGCIIYPNVAVYRGQRTRRDFNFVHASRDKGNCQPANNHK